MTLPLPPPPVQSGAHTIAANLVHSFLLPEVQKQAMRDSVQRDQRKYIAAAHAVRLPALLCAPACAVPLSASSSISRGKDIIAGGMPTAAPPHPPSLASFVSLASQAVRKDVADVEEARRVSFGKPGSAGEGDA